jgi:hypothetical protein
MRRVLVEQRFSHCISMTPASTLACIAHKSLEICERCRLGDRGGVTGRETPKSSTTVSQAKRTQMPSSATPVSSVVHVSPANTGSARVSVPVVTISPAASGGVTSFDVIWEIILRNFWDDILRVLIRPYRRWNANARARPL